MLVESVEVPADRSGGPDACWPFIGRIDDSGYGNVKSALDGRHMGAHRAAYVQAYGPIPEGLTVDHVCHNRDKECRMGNSCPHRRCMNPAHLEAVSRRENVLRAREGRYPPKLPLWVQCEQMLIRVFGYDHLRVP